MALSIDALSLLYFPSSHVLALKIGSREFWMSLEEGQLPSSIAKKRSFEFAFGSSQHIIDSVLPQVSSLIGSAASYWNRWFDSVSHYVNDRIQNWQDEDAEKLPTIAKKGKRRRLRDDETHEQRAARRASRRSARISNKENAALNTENFHADVSSPTARLSKTILPSLTPEIQTRSRTIKQRLGQPRVSERANHGSLRSLRKQYSEIITARERSALGNSNINIRGNASPMHRTAFNNSMIVSRSRMSTANTRTSKDAAIILNRITPHKSRIRKVSNSDKTMIRLPFTTSTLSRYLESPSQASPAVLYRSPGAPLGSPAANFNPFQTKDNNNRMSHRTDEQSLEDLIADLRKEYPHQYEWQKIDKEKEARNLEIARKRGLLAPVRVPIPIETLKKVEKAFFGQLPYDNVLVDKFNQEIKVKDLSTLKSTAWLNDEVINFYMNLIIERSKVESKIKLHAFNTFFYSKLVKGGYKDVRRWAKKAKVDIAGCDLVLVPVHLGVHWCMATINFRRQRFEYWDSLNGGAGQAFSALREYLVNETNLDVSEWTDYVPEAGPQQRNGFDCGVFACQTAERLSCFQVPSFSQDEMPELRKRMAASILDAKIY